MTPLQKAFLTGAAWGICAGAVTVALIVEEDKKDKRLRDLQKENAKLKVDNQLLKTDLEGYTQKDQIEVDKDVQTSEN